MAKRWKTTRKRKEIGKSHLEEKIDIDKLDDKELAYAIKNELIKWHDIKKWAEQKHMKKFK